MSGSNLIQQLEPRRLLATVNVNGTDADEVIQITRLVSGSEVFVVVNINGAEQSYNRNDVSLLMVDAGNGNDTVNIADNVTTPAQINGGGGDDSLRGGGGNDTLVGGAGNDTLDGGGTIDSPGGTNTADYSAYTVPLTIENTVTTPDGEVDTLGMNIQTLLSGSGDDAIDGFSVGAGALRYIDAGPGNDTVSLFTDGDATVHGGAGNDRIFISAKGAMAFYFGDSGNDTFTVARSSFTARNFAGGAGFDTVDWSGFINELWPVTVTLDDVANDGASNEWFNSVDKDNVHRDVEQVLGTAGNDTIIGSSGDEMLVGREGNDSLFGGDGNDTLVGDDGDDTLIGGNGEDSLDGGAGINVLQADTPPAAQFSLTNGTLRITGSDFPEEIFVRPSAADPAIIQVGTATASQNFDAAAVNFILVHGNGGNDRIAIDLSLSIATKLYGGDGNDTIEGASGSDRVYGGEGDDLVVTFSGNDIIYGENGSDSLFGGAGRDHLYGGDGTDHLSGGPGNDTMIGGQDGDTLDDSEGDDITDDVSLSAGQPTATSSLNDGVLRLSGTNAAERFFVRPDPGNPDALQAGWDEHFITMAASDVESIIVSAGGGNDAIEIDARITLPTRLYGGAGNDTIIGSSGNDRVYAGDGDDWVGGFNGNDVIYSEAGDDRLFGGNGRDYLVGGAGADAIRGEEGVDRIYASPEIDDARGNRGDLVFDEAAVI